MSDHGIDREAEAVVRAAATELTSPEPGECLVCFVARMLEAFACDCTLRFAQRYRDLVAPNATGLERRLGSMGGFCDCEIFLNGLCLADSPWEEDEEERDARPLPPCRGVRRGSTRPCALWARRSGW